MSNGQYSPERLSTVKRRIDSACKAAGRDPSMVTLIGASKKQSIESLETFYDAGLKDVGENYLQEGINKQKQLEHTSLNWHFIGSIQSNKSKLIAHHFDWVHGVDRLKIAKRLALYNPKASPIKLLIQLNPDDEDSKAGVNLGVASELANDIAQIDNLELHGFMMIPKARQSEAEQRLVFAKAKELLDIANQRYGLTMNHLSMGMSADLEAAIAEGSTMVRVGTDLFGARA